MKKETPKKEKPPIFDVEVVSWLDAETSAGWHWKDTEAYLLSPVETIGFVVKETKDLLVLAQTVANDGWHNNRSKIPKSLITKRKKLIEVKTKSK